MLVKLTHARCTPNVTNFISGILLICYSSQTALPIRNRATVHSDRVVPIHLTWNFRRRENVNFSTLRFCFFLGSCLSLDWSVLRTVSDTAVKACSRLALDSEFRAIGKSHICYLLVPPGLVEALKAVKIWWTLFRFSGDPILEIPVSAIVRVDFFLHTEQSLSGGRVIDLPAWKWDSGSEFFDDETNRLPSVTNWSSIISYQLS